MAPSATSRGRLYGALGTGAVLVGGLAYVGLGDPHSPVVWEHRLIYADEIQL